METVIIISMGTIILISGASLLYYGWVYLYEWYIENFTVDVDPDHPEREILPSWQSKILDWEKHIPNWGLLLDKTLTKITQVPKLTEKYFIDIRDKHKRRNKRLRPTRNPPSPRPSRERMRREVREKSKKSPTWMSSDEYYRQRDEILGIDPADRGNGKDYWDTRAESAKKKRDTLTAKKEIDKHFEKLKVKWEAFEDVWDTKRR